MSLHVKLFIDESLSPDFAIWLNDRGGHDAIHPLHVGRCGEPDYRVLARCFEEARIIVTQNGRDFRKLAGRAASHPGLIILPDLKKARTWELLQAGLAFLATRGDSPTSMVDHVLEVTPGASMTLYLLHGSARRR